MSVWDLLLLVLALALVCLTAALSWTGDDR